MSNLSRAVINALLPEGLAWTPAAGDDYDLLMDGIADNSEAVRADMNNLRYLRDPARTPILSDLEKEFAVIPVSQSTEAERRQRLAAAMFYRGTLPTYELLEQKLNDAGFNVHVWPNDPVVDPATFLTEAFQMTCGDILPSGNEAQCGEPEAFCGQVGGELLVNGDLYLQYPHYINLCGEADVQCGEPDALAGMFNHILLIPIVYTIPTTAGYWPLIFFVGGDRDIFPRWGAGGTGLNSSIVCMAIQTDGKIIIGGAFTAYSGVVVNRIARLNSDGSLDTTFNVGGSGANSHVWSVAIQTDGKIIVGGNFTTLNGTAINRIARLNTDGTIDATFNPGTGADGQIRTVAIQTDGKIVLSGGFLNYDGTGRVRIARINTNGTLDAGFNPGTGADGAILTMVIQTDQKIVIGGLFANYDGAGRARIARVDTNGTLDAGFNPGAGCSNDVYALALQTDQKILIGGLFTTYDGTGRVRIARINTNGTLDAGFNPGGGANDGVQDIAVQADGSIVLVGDFTSYDGTPRSKVVRIDTNGALDATFDPGTGANQAVYAVVIQVDQKILIGGFFTSYHSLPRYRIARLSTLGDNDGIFNYMLSIASAYVPIERRLEFRRIILKYKPMFSWAGLIVTYN